MGPKTRGGGVSSSAASTITSIVLGGDGDMAELVKSTEQRGPFLFHIYTEIWLTFHGQRFQAQHPFLPADSFRPLLLPAHLTHDKVIK
jgi:hypothetical protein